jgi:hypothetical protein
MISSVIRLGATALLVSVLLSSAMPASATLKPCQNARTSGVGRGPTLDIAMKNAIQNWRINTEDAYGSYFNNYRLAENHVRHCNATGGLFYCRISSQPCKSAKPTSPSMQHY